MKSKFWLKHHTAHLCSDSGSFFVLLYSDIKNWQNAFRHSEAGSGTCIWALIHRLSPTDLDLFTGQKKAALKHFSCLGLNVYKINLNVFPRVCKVNYNNSWNPRIAVLIVSRNIETTQKAYPQRECSIFLSLGLLPFRQAASSSWRWSCHVSDKDVIVLFTNIGHWQAALTDHGS